LLKHIHTSTHLYLNAESNYLNTYKKQWCKKNPLNEKYTENQPVNIRYSTKRHDLGDMSDEYTNEGN